MSHAQTHTDYHYLGALIMKRSYRMEPELVEINARRSESDNLAGNV